MGEIPVLVLNGAVGAGKPTVALARHDLLSAWALPHACADRDALSWSWPPAERFNDGMARRNLAALRQNFRAGGMSCFVLAAVLEERAMRRVYAEAMPGGQLTVCRLRAPEAMRVARLHQREQGESLAWHLARTVAPSFALLLLWLALLLGLTVLIFQRQDIES